MINVYPKYERMIEMKKKLLVGLLTVVACFTLGSTSFAASVSPSETSIESTSVKPANTILAEQYVTYNALHYPTAADVPQEYYYEDGSYAGWIPLVTLTYGASENTHYWVAQYKGWITN